MTTFDDIVDGLEKALVLERELGVRSIEIDRTLLNMSATKVVTPPPQPVAQVPRPVTQAPRPVVAQASRPTDQASHSQEPQVVIAFLSTKLSLPDSQEMIDNIRKRVFSKVPMEKMPLVLPTDSLPSAKFYVVLGSLARRRWLPNSKAFPGTWVNMPTGEPTLVTYSLDKISMMTKNSPAQLDLKHQMLQSFNELKRKLLV